MAVDFGIPGGDSEPDTPTSEPDAPTPAPKSGGTFDNLPEWGSGGGDAPTPAPETDEPPPPAFKAFNKLWGRETYSGPESKPVNFTIPGSDRVVEGRSYEYGGFVPSQPPPNPRTAERLDEYFANWDETQGVFPTFEEDEELVKGVINLLERGYHTAMRDGDEEMVRNIQEFRTLLDDSIPDEIQELYGLTTIPYDEELLDEMDPWNDGWRGDVSAFFGRTASKASGIPVLGDLGQEFVDKLGVAMRYLGTLNNGFMGAWATGRHFSGEALKDLASGDVGGAISNQMTGLAGASSFIAGGASNNFGGQIEDVAGMNVGGYSPDKNADGMINFREVLGVDPGLGGSGWWGDYVIGTADMVATLVTDPTSWTGVGTGAKSLVLMRAVGRTQGAAGLRAAIRNGWKAFDDKAIKEIYDDIVEQVTDGAQRRRASNFFRRPSEIDVDAVNARASSIFNSGSQSVRGTVRFGGDNIRIPGLHQIINRRAPSVTSRISDRGRRVLGVADDAEGSLEAAREVFGSGVEAVTPTRNGVRVTGTVRHKGQDVGTFVRRVFDDGSVAYDDLVIAEGFRGRGYARKWLQDQEEVLREAGFNSIRMPNALGDGLRVWPRRGFRLDITAPGVETNLRMLAMALRSRADELGEVGDTPVAQAVSQAADVADSAADTVAQGSLFGDDLGLPPDLSRMYHGSPTLRPGEMPSVRQSVETRGTTFWSDSEDVAQAFTYPREYGESIFERFDDELGEWVDIEPGTVAEAKLDLKSPKVIDAEGRSIDDVIPDQSRAVEEAKAAGHDGIVVTNTIEWGSDYPSTVVAVFDDASVIPYVGGEKIPYARPGIDDTERIHRGPVPGQVGAVGGTPPRIGTGPRPGTQGAVPTSFDMPPEGIPYGARPGERGNVGAQITSPSAVDGRYPVPPRVGEESLPPNLGPSTLPAPPERPFGTRQFDQLSFDSPEITDYAMRQMADDIDRFLSTGDARFIPDVQSPMWQRVVRHIDEDVSLPFVREIEGADDSLRWIKNGKAWDPTDTRFNKLMDIAQGRVSAGRWARVGAKAATAPARARSFVTPRADVKRRLGRWAEEALDSARVQGGAEVANQIEDLHNRLFPALERGAKEIQRRSSTRITRAEARKRADDMLRAALEDNTALYRNENLPRQAAKLREQGYENMADTLEVLDDLRRLAGDISVEAGLEPERILGAYFPRYLTEDGRIALSQVTGNDEVHTLLSMMGMDHGALQSAVRRHHMPRTFYADRTIDELNTEIAQKLGIDPNVKLFEDDVLAAFAMRGHAAARAAGDNMLLKKLAEESVTVGDRRMAMAVRRPAGDADWTPPSGYVPAGDINKDYYLLPDIEEDVNKIHRLLTNDRDMASYQQLIDNLGKLWAGGATAQLFDGFGFHSRNFRSNIVLNFLAGVANPADYAKALGYQRRIKNVRQRMRETGEDFDTAMSSIGMDTYEMNMLRNMRRMGVISGGWFQDLGGTGIEAGEGRPKRRKYTEKGIPGIGRRELQYNDTWDMILNNAPMKAGRAVGSFVENNARMTHFISKVESGMGAEAAGRSVRKYLFDYSDLTSFEQEKIKTWSRFYTFIRKNFAVQLDSLVKEFPRVNVAERLQGGNVSDMLGIQDPVSGQREYSAEEGAALDLREPMGLPLMAGVDTPLQAAGEVLTPMFTVVEALSGGDYEAEELINELLGVVSGQGPSLIQATYDSITQRHNAFGYDWNDYDKGAEAAAYRWLGGVVFPGLQQFDTLVERATNGEGLSFLPGFGNNATAINEEHGWELAILNNVLGLQLSQIDPYNEVESDMFWNVRTEIEQYLQKIPESLTVADLERLGLIPERPGSAPRAASEVTQEDIAEYRAKGLDTSELELELQEELLDEAEQGYIYNDDGTYTTANQRAKEWITAAGFVDEEGEAIWNNTSKAAHNQARPQEPILDEDGVPYGVYHLPVIWDPERYSSESEVIEWWEETTGNVRNSTTVDIREAYNEAHRDRPYIRDVDERLEAGLLVQGVVERTEKDDDGNIIATNEYFPAGQSADNWSVYGRDDVLDLSGNGTNFFIPDS